MIIIAGHTKKKMDYVCSIIPSEFNCIKIFNGVEKYPGAIITPNHHSGRDVDMYHKAMLTSDNNVFAFINDDIKYLGEQFWEEYKNFNSDICGVGNLASWVDISKLSGWIYDKTLIQQKNQKKVMFIRTAAFITTKEYFLKVFSSCNNVAQKFEKNTLKFTSNYKLLNPEDAYDTNIQNYVKKSS